MSLGQALQQETLSSSTAFREGNGLDPDSYTAHRLNHATPQHLHITTRRCFIGPIPEDWLKTRTHRLNFSTYSSRSATFAAANNVSNHRQVTGLDSTAAAATYGLSFPQPENATDEEEDDEQTAPYEGRCASIESSSKKNTTGTAKPETAKLESNTNEPGRFVRARTSRHPRRRHDPGHELEDNLSPQSEGGISFVTAFERQDDKRGSSDKKTHDEVLNNNGAQTESSRTEHDIVLSSNGSSLARMSSSIADLSRPGEATGSTSSLLPHAGPPAESTGKGPSERPGASGAEISLKEHVSGPKEAAKGSDEGVAKLPELHTEEPEEYIDPSEAEPQPLKSVEPVSTGLVRFHIPDKLTKSEGRAQAKIAKIERALPRRPAFRKNKLQPGEIIKVEKFLVRVDSTMQDLPADYDENSSQKSDSRVLEKWREYVVVCRRSVDEEAECLMQMYKSRIIPAVEQARVEKRATHQIVLKHKITRLNLYSSLDKTIVLWTPSKRGTKIYILQARSSATSVEWYTFLRSVLGWKRPSSLNVIIPDLNVTLQLERPFEDLEAFRDAVHSTDTVQRATDPIKPAGKAVASVVIQRCMKMLENSPEWSDVIDKWLSQEKIGLAWKRYDRLEWVHGANEQRMYGTLAMQQSHDLELLPKQHYPTTVSDTDKSEVLKEPTPVEGFLVRLTSQRGKDQRMGKNFFKRLYFSTHNQFLCFCRPAKATPPPPPKLREAYHAQQLPSAREIMEKIPLIYAVNPYPLTDDRVSWLASKNAEALKEHDQKAYDEAERKIRTLLEAEGYINLSHVVHVRHFRRRQAQSENDAANGATAQAQDGDATITNETMQQTHDDYSFELVLKNGLSVRFRAYDQTTKEEWMTRLNQIIRYWKLRIVDDTNVYKMVRQTNFQKLEIDEEMESYLGQYAKKWEVSRAVASPQLFNMCGISCCRAITMSGVLYHKARLHATFKRCGVMLCHGKLLIFQATLRKYTGKEIPHTHHERQQVIDLKDTYIYSGLITEDDLLYQNRTFDSNHPGHHALPRVYLEDSWTSSDEDTMTCFAIWHGKRKSFFRASAEDQDGKLKQRLKYVSRLGATGRSMVFKTRSRAERDHWVMSIGMEIERLQQAEEIRVVSKK